MFKLPNARLSGSYRYRRNYTGLALYVALTLLTACDAEPVNPAPIDSTRTPLIGIVKSAPEPRIQAIEPAIEEDQPEPSIVAELQLDDPYRIETSVLFKEEDFKLAVPYYASNLLSRRVEYGVGRLSSRSIYAKRERDSYLNKSFAPTAAIPLPDEGFGAYGTVKAGRRLAFTAGIHEADAVADQWNTDFVEQGSYFSAMGIDYRPAWSESDNSHYKLTLWRKETGATNRDRSGFAVHYEKSYGNNVSWSPFVRYSYQQADALKVSQLSTTGLSIGNLPWQRDSRIGIAYAHQQTERVDQAAHTLEMYYRVRPMPYLELTPDIQFVQHPTEHPALEQMTISRLSLRVLF